MIVFISLFFVAFDIFIYYLYYLFIYLFIYYELLQLHIECISCCKQFAMQLFYKREDKCNL